MTPAPLEPQFAAADVDRLDVRMGTIRRVKDVPGRRSSSPHRRLRRPRAADPRRAAQERSDPREIEGLQALFVVNMEPRRMAGEVSEGMLFDIGYADGVTPVLAVPEKPVPNGTRAG